MNEAEMLQDQLTDHSVPTSVVLQKALILATKIDDGNFIAWVQRELDGYANRDADVEYRCLKGRYVVLTPDNRVMPIDWQNSASKMNSRFLTAPVGELESLILSNGDSVIITINVTPNEITSFELEPGDRIGFQVEQATLIGFLQTIRNKVLEWTLRPSVAKAMECSAKSKPDDDQLARHNEKAETMRQTTKCVDPPKDLLVDVLISWSKKQSRELATVLHSWLPKVVPGLRPWMSSKDIDKGKQWFGELQGFLGEATSCIICVTAENVRSPWIYYESGAIAAKKQEVLVCPYLIGIDTSMISDGPLAQYQCTEATKNDTLALIRSLNKALANPHDEGLLTGNFESMWPEFEQELNRVLALEVEPEKGRRDQLDVVIGEPKESGEKEKLLTSSNEELERNAVDQHRKSGDISMQSAQQNADLVQKLRENAIKQQFKM